MRRERSLLLLLSVGFLLASCSLTGILDADRGDPPRTFYETLDLSSPEASVEIFADAFARDDFLTVYLILSARSQFIFTQRLRLFDYSYIIEPGSFERIRNDVTLFAEGVGTGEHADESWYIFDQIMLAAKSHDALLIDLTAEVTITNSSSVEFLDYEATVDVHAEVDGIQGDVIFRMIQAPSGNWRVYQVITPGGNIEMVPWAVPDGSG
jgi:hypothetical protein